MLHLNYANNVCNYYIITSGGEVNVYGLQNRYNMKHWIIIITITFHHPHRRQCCTDHLHVHVRMQSLLVQMDRYSDDSPHQHGPDRRGYVHCT